MADTVNLKKSYSALNEKIIKLFDEAGVRRSFTVPYVEGQNMHDHLSAVGQAAAQSGGLTRNLMTTAHHSTGKGWGSGEGHTVAHPADKLRTTVIPKNDENAKAAIAATQNHISNVAKLLGDDDPAVQTAQNQLNLVKKSDGAGMNLLDFGVMMIQLLHGPNRAVAKAHSGTKEGGHAPHLRAAAPEPGQEAPETQAAAPGEAQPAGQAPTAQAAAPAAPEAPTAPAAA